MGGGGTGSFKQAKYALVFLSVLAWGTKIVHLGSNRPPRMAMQLVQIGPRPLPVLKCHEATPVREVKQPRDRAGLEGRRVGRTLNRRRKRRLQIYRLTDGQAYSNFAGPMAQWRVKVLGLDLLFD